MINSPPTSMMASAALRLHLARPPPPLLSTLHKIPLSFSLSYPFPTLSPPLLSSPLRLLSSSSSLTPIPSPPLPHPLHGSQGGGAAASDDESDLSSAPEELQGDERQLQSDDPDMAVPHQAPDPPPVAVSLPRFPSPDLTVREKKELASYAHGLGKKLKCQQVGKSGVTPSVAASFVENLESNELLKLKVHGSCPGELSDVIKQLEESTGSVAVGQIGRSVILYRPSVSKMKKKEAQSARKVWNPKPTGSSTTFESQKKGKWSQRQHQSRQRLSSFK